MSNIRDHFDIKLFFWSEFPEYKNMQGFGTMYRGDRSTNRKKSSKIAWSIHLAYHPDSKFYNIPNKLELIARDVIKDTDFKWDTSVIQDAIDIYKTTVLTQAERSMDSWNETMVLRDKGLKQWYKNEFEKAIEKRDIDIITNLDKQMSNTAKFFMDYKKIKNDLNEEQDSKKKSKIISESDSDDF